MTEPNKQSDYRITAQTRSHIITIADILLKNGGTQVCLLAAAVLSSIDTELPPEKPKAKPRTKTKPAKKAKRKTKRARK